MLIFHQSIYRVDTMRRKRKQFVICLSIILITIIIILNRKSIISCDDTRGRRVLHDMCMLYERNKISGSFCQDICHTGAVMIGECLSHKDDNVIFSAKWSGKRVVLKTKRIPTFDDWNDAFPEHLNQDLGELQATFLETVHDHVMLNLVNYREESNFRKLLREKISTRNLLSLLYFNVTITSLERKDMRSIWSLLKQDEFYILQLLQKFKHVPKVLGSCGHFYVMEEVEVFDNHVGMRLTTTKHIQYNKSIALALDFMDLIKEFDSESSFGPWQHCDIQPSNFGISQDGVIKVVDVDLMFTNTKMLEVLGSQSKSCTNDQQCDFFDCFSQCDLDTNQCSNNRISNNLQMICRDVFTSSWTYNGLIARNSRSDVNKILKECSVIEHTPWTREKYQRIYDTLRNYFLEERQSTLV